jgi:6-phosphogluconolactonase (cycloisomerase 2 family)
MKPTGMFLYSANQGSDNISGLSINVTTGALTPISGSPFGGVTNPFELTIVRIP